MRSNKSWGKEAGGKGDIWSYDICLSQVAVMHDEGLLSWKWLNICPRMGSRECIYYFAWFVRAALALLIKLSLSQHTSLLTFTLPILSPIPLWRE